MARYRKAAEEAPPEENGAPEHQQSKKPVAAFKYGASGGGFIEATVWPREMNGDNNSTYTVFAVTFHRSYYDGKKKEWKTTNSVRHSDVPILIQALHEAWEWVLHEKTRK